MLDGEHGDTRWQLLAGRIVGMVTPTIAHALISNNLGDALALAVAPQGCNVFRTSIGVQSAEDDARTYRPVPDLVVHCREVDQRRRYVTDPVVVVEVLSPSIMDDDRGVKLDFYRSIATLRHIVLVYQDQMRVEHSRRTELAWETVVLTKPEDVLELDAAQVGVKLRAIFARVELG